MRDRFAFRLNGKNFPPTAFAGKFMASDPLPADRPMPPYLKFEVDLAKLCDVRTGWNTLRGDVLGGDDTCRPSDMYRGLDLILFEAELRLSHR
ncbi:MAG: hypothetical protein HY360_03590 [Verrucomicrobia bacterium]|nr:hypothetical protein [Verrucomicrobiota bacterium]